MRAILLPVGEELFALTIDLVREVVTSPQVTALATAPSSVRGVFSLRGEVLPILDTAQLVRRPVPERDAAAFAVVVQCGDVDVALVASTVPTIVDLGTVVQPSDTPGALGTYLVAERLVTLVEPQALLANAGYGATPASKTGG